MLVNVMIIMALMVFFLAQNYLVPTVPVIKDIFAFVKNNWDRELKPEQVQLPCLYREFDHSNDTRHLLMFWHVLDLKQRIQSTANMMFRIGVLYAVVKLLLVLAISVNPSVNSELAKTVTTPWWDLVLVALFVYQMYVYGGEWERYRLMAPGRAEL